MNIAEIRQKYPQYSDLSDTQLADALHSKYYSDMPKGDFYAKIGFGIGVQPQAEFESGVPQPVQIAQAPNAVVPGLGEITTGMQAAPDSIWEGSTPGADAFPIEQPEQIPSWRLPSPVADPSHVSAVQESLPVLGGMAGSLMGGPQAGLVVSSALGGLGTAGGELVRQPFAGEPLSFEKAGKKGAMAFGAGLVGGSFFRGLLGRGVEDDLGQSALKFAEGKGAPMPPGTMQGRVIAQVARAPALGDLYVAQQAGKVSQVVDDEIAKYSGVGSVDDMVTAAKDMIGNKLDARSGYEGILNAVGGNTKIPLTNTTDFAVSPETETVTAPVLVDPALNLNLCPVA